VKISKTLLLIPAFAALAGSCSNDNEALQPEALKPVVVRATTEYTEVPATRTLFGEVAPTDGSTAYSVSLKWNDDSENPEKIDVMGFDTYGYPSGEDYTPFTGVAHSRSTNGKSMSFTADAYPESDSDRYAYFYPSGEFETREAVLVTTKNDLSSGQKQSGNNSLAHLQAVNWMYSELSAPEEAFTLKPLTAIFRFDLTFPKAVTNGTIMLSSGTKNSFVSMLLISYDRVTASVDYYSKSNSLFVEIADITVPTTHLTVYAMTGGLPNGHFDQGGATLTLKAMMGQGTFTTTLGTTKDDARFLPGMCYNFVVGADKWDDD
jgi:hypothetical protein